MDFRECEFLDTWVNKGKEKGRGCFYTPTLIGYPLMLFRLLLHHYGPFSAVRQVSWAQLFSAGRREATVGGAAASYWLLRS